MFLHFHIGVYTVTMSAGLASVIGVYVTAM